MRYPALEYQPGIAAEQAEPARAAPGTPGPTSRPRERPPRDADTARPLDNPTSISAGHPRLRGGGVDQLVQVGVVLQVVGQDGEAVGAGGRRDEQVDGALALAAAAPAAEGAERGVLAGDGI